MATKVSDVLRHKGFAIVSVAPMQTIAAVVEVLTQHRIGAAPVTDEAGRLIGIISERDIVRGMSQHGIAVLTLPTESLMTREVKTCTPDDPLVALMEIMTNQRIRHLPVVEGGALKGIVSIGDVVKQRLAEAQLELEELHRYISASNY
ncbi:MAG: CBS domain-containing protein [Candidatus Binataceae bacterium]